MGITVIMKIEPNQCGLKEYYCWENDILHIAAVDWQDIIYGFYNDKTTKGWNLAIKRNAETNGRSSHYYQVVVPVLALPILNIIADETVSANQKEILDLLIESFKAKINGDTTKGIDMAKIEEILNKPVITTQTIP